MITGQESVERCQFWQTHIDKWATSGITQAEYCRQNVLRPNRFTYWKTKSQKVQISSELVPVPISALSPTNPAGEPSPPEIRLTVDSRYELSIPERFSSTCLETVLRIVDKVSCCRFQ